MSPTPESITAVTLLRGATGINNVVAPERVEYDPKTGVGDLSEGVNVRVDDSLRLCRRRGYVQLRADAAHSLYSYNGRCLYVSGNSLYELNRDWTRTGIRSDLSDGLYMSYAGIGTEIFHCNGAQTGVVREDGIAYAWVGSEYVGPEKKIQITTTAPVGHLIAVMGGYLLMAVDNLLVWSLQFAPYWWALQQNLIQFNTALTMVMPVDDGVWLSEIDKLYFLRGTDPTQWKMEQVGTDGAIPGSPQLIESHRVGRLKEFNIGGMSAIWLSQKGICAGAPTGQYFNLTYEKIAYPPVLYAAGFVSGNEYITSMKP